MAELTSQRHVLSFRCSGLSREDFVARYELPNKPVVLTDAMDGWQALKKWDRAYLSQQFKGKKVTA